MVGASTNVSQAVQNAMTGFHLSLECPGDFNLLGLATPRAIGVCICRIISTWSLNRYYSGAYIHWEWEMYDVSILICHGGNGFVPTVRLPTGYRAAHRGR